MNHRTKTCSMMVAIASESSSRTYSQVRYYLRMQYFFFLVWVVTKSSPLALLRYLETAPINYYKAVPWYQLCQSPAKQSPTNTVQASAFTSGISLPTYL